MPVLELLAPDEASIGDVDDTVHEDFFDGVDTEEVEVQEDSQDELTALVEELETASPCM